MLTWTAILALPGGVLLLPVVVANRLAKRQESASSTPDAAADETAEALAEDAS